MAAASAARHIARAVGARPSLLSVPISGSVQPRRTMAAAAAESRAAPGDFVQVHYTGTLDDGSEFDSSRPRGSPLEFIVGGGKVIKGFDLAVTGLAVGEKRKSRIEPQDAYGEVNPEMVIRVPASRAPPGLKAGLQVQLSNGMVGTCTKIDDKEVVLDLNHELAGKPLTFDVELVGLTPKGRMATVALGMGCFWGPELRFQRVPGVLSTSVGYANYKGEAPDYDAVCTGQTGASEVVNVVYDTGAITFEQILDVFWEGHDPTTLNRQGGDAGTQYRSGVYVSSPEQLAAAQKSKEAAQARFPQPIVTEITTLDTYTDAEPYHQQYLARGGRFGKPQNPAKKCNDAIRCYG